MTGVEPSSATTATTEASEGDEAFRNITFDHSFDSQLEQLEVEPCSSFDSEAEWDPADFDRKKSSNPKWKKKKNKQKSHPKRIQDIRLSRLDSGSGVDSDKDRCLAGEEDDNWPYEEEEPLGSPCALFGSKMSRAAEGFEGEFSTGDPEWEMNNKKSSSSRRRSKNSSSSNRRLMAAQQQQQQPDDDGSLGSYELENGSQNGSKDYNSEDDSEHSVTDSPTYEDDNVMVTPAMGKTRQQQRKKPPTLKRGAHGVQTPSIVKALKGKHAFTVSDEEDNVSIDFDAEYDSDLDSAGSGHSNSKNKSSNGSRSKRDGRLEASSSAFRRANMSKKNFSFDRSMSSADLKAARKANNSFKGKSEMNKSFSALSESKRRMHRSKSGSRQDKMQNSFNNSSGKINRRPSASSHVKSPSREKQPRKTPSRAKSMGNQPTTGKSKLISGLSKFAGSTEEPPSATAASGKKSYGSTLSALKVLSGAQDGGGGDSKASDLKSAIMQQVYRSSSMNPIELKRKPKPKITKANSLSASGMARAAAASGDIFASKESSKDAPKPTGRVRRSKTADGKSSNVGDFNASYHESIAKMRKQKMADASDKSALSAASMESTRSKSSHEPASSSKDRNNIGRCKSFSHSSRAGERLDMAEAEAAEASPGSRSRMKRGSSKRLMQAQDGDDLDAASSGHTGRRGLQKSGSSRRLQKEKNREYDASPQRPTGTNVITLLKKQEPVTDSQMMQKGNRQLFHALMYRTRMGIDMEQLRLTVEGGGEDDEGSASGDSK